jgi:hypothetical protein
MNEGQRSFLHLSPVGKEPAPDMIRDRLAPQARDG